jgi:hypothetical protein
MTKGDIYYLFFILSFLKNTPFKNQEKNRARVQEVLNSLQSFGKQNNTAARFCTKSARFAQNGSARFFFALLKIRTNFVRILCRV